MTKMNMGEGAAPLTTNEVKHVESSEKIEIAKFADLTVPHTEDLQNQISNSEDISYLSKDLLESASFDSNFKWPKRLPEGFNPQELIEECKNPGLGIRELHREGITGKGIIVGIIDQSISPTHVEIKDSLMFNKIYHESDIEEDGVSMHGPAVASLFVGKNCGVAPGAKLIYADVGQGGGHFEEQARALEDMIIYNNVHETKIKIVSCSRGYSDDELEVPEVKKWIEIKKRAKELGMYIIDSNYFRENLITGGGSRTDKDKYEDYELPLFYDKSDDPGLTSNLINYELIVPSDYRSMASRQGDNEYRHDAIGGWSWAIPYYAGVFALALQVNPNLTDDKFLEIVRKTAGTSKKGFKVVNPLGIIEEVKKVSV